jgi:hypothetical protein
MIELFGDVAICELLLRVTRRPARTARGFAPVLLQFHGRQWKHSWISSDQTDSVLRLP